MAGSTPLHQDILLFQKNTHGKNVRIHEWAEFLADRRVVTYHSRYMRRRLWGLLPMEIRETQVEPLPIPVEITTEEQLRQFLKAHRGVWRRITR